MTRRPIAPTLFPDMAPSVARRGVLPDLLYGTIPNVWAQIVTHYVPPRIPLPVIADLTCRDGEMWKHCASGYRVLRFDVDPSVTPDAVADCRWPAMRRSSCEAVVVDVPWSLDPGKGRGYAASRYGSRFTSVAQVLGLFRGANWAPCVRDGGWAFVRCQASHHGGKPVMLPQRIVPRVEDGSAWELWDEAVHMMGNPGAQAAMKDPPKLRYGTSRFLVFRKTKTKIPFLHG